MQVAASCNWGCDILLEDAFARQVLLMSIKRGGGDLSMGQDESSKTRESSVSLSDEAFEWCDEGTDLAFLCM